MDSKALKILIVDDEKQIRDFLNTFLKKEGYTVIDSAETGGEALDKVRQGPPKLVLLDVKLPDIDGLSVLREIKKIDDKVGIIMITAFPDIKIAEEAMKIGAFDYIVKPFDLAYLKLCVLTKLFLVS